MKGVVFDLLEDIVTDEYGADAWDDLLSAAGLEGAYTTLGSYPDEDLLALVGAASGALKLPPDEVVRWFGRRAMPRFAERHEDLLARYRSTQDLVLGLNDIIHPEVRKLYPGAFVPEFGYDEVRPGHVAMSYVSPRRLCAFAEGLVQGATDVYGERVEIAQPECMLRGDARCLIVLDFA